MVLYELFTHSDKACSPPTVSVPPLSRRFRRPAVPAPLQRRPESAPPGRVQVSLRLIASHELVGASHGSRSPLGCVCVCVCLCLCVCVSVCE